MSIQIGEVAGGAALGLWTERPKAPPVEKEVEYELSAFQQCPWLERFSGHRVLLRGYWYLAVKRFMDLTLSLVLLVLTLPLLVLCLLALKIESPSAPVFFVQRRSGKGGNRFSLFKFRTMVVNAESMKNELMHLNQRKWPDFKIDNDPRITRVGRILRATSLDELPQLINILRGDMSLVGPRPISLSVDAHEYWQTERFDVRPGLTGLWQVAGRESTSFTTRVRLDIRYVERQSLLLDLVILIRTIPTVLLGRGSV